MSDQSVVTGEGEFAIAGEYLVALQEFALGYGVTPQQLFQGVGISPATLLIPGFRVGHLTMARIIANLGPMLDDAALAVLYGQSLTLSRHGVLGYAARSCRDLRGAVQMLIRYIHTRSGGSESLELIESEERVKLRLYCSFGDLAAPIVRFEVLSQLVSIESIGRLLIGTDGADNPTEIHLAFEGCLPEDLSLRSPGLSIHFGQAVNEIQFARDALDKPVLFADAAMEQQARLVCERELEGVARDAGVEARIRMLVRERLGRPTTLEQIADALDVSVRTVKRRLQEAGISFQQIKDEERYHRAMFLLETTQKSQEDLADMLGFSDASNFAKAFRGWAGMSPTEFRARMLAER